MITHVVTIVWKPDVTAEHVQKVRVALMTLPDIIQEIQTYHCGPDLGVADGNAQFAVVATFESVQGWRAYSTHPAHVQVITELMRPFLTTRTAVQFEH